MSEFGLSVLMVMLSLGVCCALLAASTQTSGWFFTGVVLVVAPPFVVCLLVMIMSGFPADGISTDARAQAARVSIAAGEPMYRNATRTKDLGRRVRRGKPDVYMLIPEQVAVVVARGEHHGIWDARVFLREGRKVYDCVSAEACHEDAMSAAIMKIGAMSDTPARRAALTRLSRARSTSG